MHFGVDYYPEHWPESRWETDAELMRDMRIEVVRLAEFSWQKLEPALGRFDFGWLDRALAVLAGRGIKAVLGTPSAAPPAWIIEANPEILPVDSSGVTRGFGGRHHDCQSNPTYRAHIARIVTAMADHYGKNPQIVGWQIDNELGNSHADLCHCASCSRAFRSWLKKKYGSINELNRRWGTAFWSQGYDAFDQVPSPRITPNGHSPSLLLDWRRFHSELIVDFHRFQSAIIRERAEGQFITHNLMGFADLVDYFDLARDLDFASHDQYVMGFWEKPPDGENPHARVSGAHRDAAALDLIAGLKRRTFWIMEQQAGATGWEIMGSGPEPGQLALWAAQSIAHGSDTVVFFRWRTCTFGTEQYWHGILPHSGIPGRRYRELKSLTEKLAPVMDHFAGALPGAEAALFFSYEQNWAFKIQPHHPELDYVNQVLAYYRAFFERNIPVDFVNEHVELGAYKLVIAPLLHLSSPALEARFADYVRGGGRLVLTMRTGVKNQDNVCMSDHPLPGAYGSLLGIEISEYDCLRNGPVPVMFDGKVFSGSKWRDLIELKGAKNLASCAGGPYSGNAIITEAEAGKGKAWYVGTEPDQALMAAFMKVVIAEAGISSLGDTPAGVELARRRTGKTDYLFALNHTAEEKRLQVPHGWKPLVGGTVLGSYGFSVFAAAR
jgi:beta-galactosidase